MEHQQAWCNQRLKECFIGILLGLWLKTNEQTKMVLVILLEEMRKQKEEPLSTHHPSGNSRNVGTDVALCVPASEDTEGTEELPS